MKQLSFIVIYALAASAFLYFLEQSVGVNYAIKTALKVCLFLIIPLLYTRYTLPQQNSLLKNIQALKPKDLLFGLTVGMISFIAILIAYIILGKYIDFPSIANELQTKLKITPLNFIFIGIYITFVNSLLEEYFFRSFVFLNLYERIPPFISYTFSSLLFALYHLAIFAQWFTLPITILCLFGLFTVGLVFNYMNSRSGHFLNSWLAHMLADAAIILVGLRMFGLL